VVSATCPPNKIDNPLDAEKRLDNDAGRPSIGSLRDDLPNDRRHLFIDAMCLCGDADTIKRGLRAHFTAGAKHVCVQPAHDEGDVAVRDRMLKFLADTKCGVPLIELNYRPERSEGS
jgi:hypothetical protein